LVSRSNPVGVGRVFAAISIEALSESGRDRTGAQFPNMHRDLTGDLSFDVMGIFQRSGQWREFETALLKFVEEPDKAVMELRVQVDDFLRGVHKATGRKTFRRDIWRAVGHTNPRKFQFWQAGSSRAAREDDRNFRRILAMEPTAFADLLGKLS
jgi:hypothetical protein